MSAKTEVKAESVRPDFEFPGGWTDFGYGDFENIVLNFSGKGAEIIPYLEERGLSGRYAAMVIEMLQALEDMANGDWRAAVRSVNDAIRLADHAQGGADGWHGNLQPFFGVVDEQVIALALGGPIQLKHCPFKRLQRFLDLWTGGELLDYGVDHRAGVRSIRGLVRVRQRVVGQFFQLRKMVIEAFKWKCA